MNNSTYIIQKELQLNFQLIEEMIDRKLNEKLSPLIKKLDDILQTLEKLDTLEDIIKDMRVMVEEN